eukprot:scaffold344977_cov38-Prasinocladus_malaysianus.AAC.1
MATHYATKEIRCVPTLSMKVQQMCQPDMWNKEALVLCRLVLPIVLMKDLTRCKLCQCQHVGCVNA